MRCTETLDCLNATAPNRDIRLWRRYSRLPLTSELDALCAEYAHPAPCLGSALRYESLFPSQNEKKHRILRCFVCAKRKIVDAKHHIIGRKPTSFEATPQPRSFVPQAAMKLPLRANDVACATQMMLCLRHK